MSKIKKQRNYFGITELNNSNLSESVRRRLSKILFISPDITASKAQEYIKENDTDEKAKSLITELEGIFRLSKIFYKTIYRGMDTYFFEELPLWVDAFGFPNLCEFKEVTSADLNLIDKKKFILVLTQIALSYNLPEEKVKFFLNNYHSLLNEEDINKILDNYLSLQ